MLFRAPDNRVHLFFKVGTTVPSWRSWAMVSEDCGASWFEPREIAPTDPLTSGPVRCKPIVLSDGAWLAGNSIETEDRWDVFVDRSDDQGATWAHSERIELTREGFDGKGVIQPTLWESSPGRAHLFARSTWGRFIAATPMTVERPSVLSIVRIFPTIIVELM